MRAMLSLIVLLMLPGCERAMHNMYDQPRYQGLRASTLFADGASARPRVPGTEPVAQGVIASTSSGRAGTSSADIAEDERAQVIPYPITAQLLERGRERFDIYCAPCHSPLGDGDGRVPRRGFPHPPSYHIDRLRNAPDRHFYDVITQGYGIMYSYADRVVPSDRWAIVAYIRALQLSQYARLSDLAPEDRQRFGR